MYSMILAAKLAQRNSIGLGTATDAVRLQYWVILINDLK